MIIAGIKALHKKTGSSRQALEKYIEENYPERQDSKRWIRITLNKLTQSGEIEKVRASYKLPPKNPPAATTKRTAKRKAATRPTPKPKSKPTKVARAPKKTKTTRAKKAPATTPATSTTASTTSGVVAAESSGKPHWQYFHGTWQNYDPEGSDLVETQYQEWLNNNQMFDVRSVKSGTWEYNVDFRKMVQINIQHASHTERKIRRYVQ